MKMKFAFKYIIVLNIFIASSYTLRISVPEGGKLNFTAQGVKYGHPVEEHEVETEDGYIIRLFHIRGKRKMPVLLLHGIADNADVFVIRGPTSLALSLASAGYDVWAGNVRGNKYSRRHSKLNPDKDREFWDFTFHEIGYYDVPAMIDYILQTTGEKKLQTIGHSQGATTQFSLLSQRAEYNEKIQLFIAMGPVTYLTDLIEPLRTISYLAPIIFEMSRGIEEVFPENSTVLSLMKLICSQDFLSYEICLLWSGFYFYGFDTKRIEPEFTKVLAGHYPDHTSRKSLMHSYQLIISKRFCEFDYGPAENLIRYGYMVPPDYNLRKVNTKVALLLGENDPLARIKDNEILRSVLPNVVSYHIMEDKLWNHADFVVANDMNTRFSAPHSYVWKDILNEKKKQKQTNILHIKLTLK